MSDRGTTLCYFVELGARINPNAYTSLNPSQMRELIVENKVKTVIMSNALLRLQSNQSMSTIIPVRRQ